MSASIVCGVDGSPDSQAALEVAARLSARLGLRLVIAHVAEPAYIPRH
jgi:nucleotide-binding universal stress UspA family protein